jgi:hypothetical protein
MRIYEQAAVIEKEKAFPAYKRAKDELRRAEEKLGHMPFAFFCAADHPTTKEFASKMVGILVVVLCEGLSGKWEVGDVPCLSDAGVPLDSDRAAYRDLVLRRIG